MCFVLGEMNSIKKALRSFSQIAPAAVTKPACVYHNTEMVSWCSAVRATETWNDTNKHQRLMNPPDGVQQL